jgi:hypothetical protein
MKHLIVRSSIVFGLLAASTVAALAQLNSQIHVHVPFQFVLGRTIMPAGDYVIHQDSTSGIVSFESRGLHGSAVALSINEGGASRDKTPRLVFQREGGKVVLTHIEFSDFSASFSHPTLISSVSR